MKDEITREKQFCKDLREKKGLVSLGLMTNQGWNDDPKHLVFTLSRYKFVAKMFSGLNHVLEVGCGDAFGTRIVLQEVNMITAVDFDPMMINDVKDRMDKDWEFICKIHDIVKAPVEGDFDGVFALDVIEHLKKDNEDRFVQNMVKSLNEHGILIIGTPSIHSQVYASEASKAGHFNCKDYKKLKALLYKYFYNVFIFSMNDEVVHTGYPPLAHYLFALCCKKK